MLLAVLFAHSVLVQRCRYRSLTTKETAMCKSLLAVTLVVLATGPVAAINAGGAAGAVGSTGGGLGNSGSSGIGNAGSGAGQATTGSVGGGTTSPSGSPLRSPASAPPVSRVAVGTPLGSVAVPSMPPGLLPLRGGGGRENTQVRIVPRLGPMQGSPAVLQRLTRPLPAVAAAPPQGSRMRD